MPKRKTCSLQRVLRGFSKARISGGGGGVTAHSVSGELPDCTLASIRNNLAKAERRGLLKGYTTQQQTYSSRQRRFVKSRVRVYVRVPKHKRGRS